MILLNLEKRKSIFFFLLVILLFSNVSISSATILKTAESFGDTTLTKLQKKELEEIEQMLLVRMRQEQEKMATAKAVELQKSQPVNGLNGKGLKILNVQSGNLPTQAEYSALMDFYQATGGANWINKTGWSTANPSVIQDVSGFAGISTNSAGNVVGIYLPMNNVFGQIPESFGNLVYLEQVYLFSNKLYQKIPQSIGNLINLKGLYLNSSQLDWHTIPATLGNLTNLEYLHLHSNYLIGTIPSTFSQLTKLKELYLLNTKLNGEIPSFIGSMTNMMALRMENSEFSGPLPSSLANLTQMVDFRLHNNKFTGPVPSYLCNFPNLNVVTLYQNFFSGEFPSCLFSKNLSYLLVAENSFNVESLVEMASYFTSTSNFLPQKQSIDTVYIQVKANSTLNLSTNLGRNTVQASRYRWIKDGVPLFSDFRLDAYTFQDAARICQLNGVGLNNCNGIYYVEITNPNLPAGTVIKGPIMVLETIPSLNVLICDREVYDFERITSSFELIRTERNNSTASLVPK